jgi:hypothetical protein
MYNPVMSEDGGMFQSPSLVEPEAKATAESVRDALSLDARELAERTYARWAKQEFRATVSHIMEVGMKSSTSYSMEGGRVVRFAHHSLIAHVDTEDLPELLEAMVLQFAAAVTSSVANYKKIDLIDALETHIQDRPGNYFTFVLKQRYAAAV